MSSGTDMSSSPPSFRPLIPLLVFILCFLGTCIFFSLTGHPLGFYALSPFIPALPALIVAMALAGSFRDEFLIPFFHGLINKNILVMCAIFLLASIFSSIAGSIGSIEAAVNTGLAFISPRFILPGLFALSGLIAIAMGTSVGTITAIAPLAAGLATHAGLSPLLTAGAVISGAMLGDNLSIISDTTIAATRTQNCKPREKLLENMKIALPAALLTFLVFLALSEGFSPTGTAPADPLKLIPYALVIIFAISGLHVFIVLLGGIVSALIIGLMGDYTLVKGLNDAVTGSFEMKGMMLLYLIISGLGNVAEAGKGFVFLEQKLTGFFERLSPGKKQRQKQIKGELSIATLVTISNLSTANNTIAILLSGNAAKNIADHAGISPQRSASILDIFSCVVQGLIPFGAQLLILSASFKLAPTAVATVGFYPLILACVTLGFIFFRP